MSAKESDQLEPITETTLKYNRNSLTIIPRPNPNAQEDTKHN